MALGAVVPSLHVKDDYGYTDLKKLSCCLRKLASMCFLLLLVSAGFPHSSRPGSADAGTPETPLCRRRCFFGMATLHDLIYAFMGRREI